MERSSKEVSDSSSTNTPKQNQIRITGKVSDVNGEGIIGAVISLIDSSDKCRGHGAVTDFDGNFDFSFDRTNYSPSCYLRIHCLGYKSRIFSVSDISFQTKTFILEPDTAVLETVLISGRPFTIKEQTSQKKKSWFQRIFGRKPKH